MAFGAFSGPPGGKEVAIDVKYWGSGIETAVDSDQDPLGLKLSLSMVEARGSFGAASAYITSEFAVDPTTERPAAYLPLRRRHRFLPQRLHRLQPGAGADGVPLHRGHDRRHGDPAVTGPMVAG